MGYNAAKREMKKIIILLLIIAGIITTAKSQDNHIYKVTVTVKVIYEYYDGGNLVSTQTGTNET